MKKIKLKAFTLIELMAVVLIIGILSIITVAAVNYSIRNAKEKLYSEQISRLESGVKTWSIENTDLLPEDGTGIVFFSVDRLKDEGIVDSELITDPRNNEELTGCMTIKYNETYKQYEYKYEELSCENVSGGYLPVITIINGTTQFLEVNEEYSFPLATAVDYTGRSVAVTGPIIRNSSNQIVTAIDSSIVGSSYTLSYSSTDEKLQLTKVSNVNLTIRDTVAPTITCGTSSVSYSVTHAAGPGFVNPTCVVKDNSCGINGTTTTVNGCASTLTPTVTATGFTPTIPGTYSIYYTATDSSSNAKLFTITVVVQDTTAPGVPTVTAKINTSTGAAYNGATSWTNQNVWLGLDAFEEGSGIKFYEQSVNCTGTYTTITPNGTNYYLQSIAAATMFNGNICFRAQDNVNLIGNVATVPIKIDKINPTVVFGTNGNATWSNSGSTTVTVSDADSGVDTPTLEYQWTTSTTQPTEASFTVPFTNGTTIPSPAGVNGTYYLWIIAKDRANNTTYSRTNAFNLDNSNPTITANNASSSWFTSRTTTITGTDNYGIAEIRYQWNTNGMNAACTTGGTVTTTGTALTVPAGSNQLFLCIRDNAGNTATYASGANMFRVDITPPVLTISGLNPYEINVGGTFVEPGRSATDNSGLTPTITNTAIPSTASNGTHTITYTATDAAGNTATATRSLYVWTGWSAWSTTNPTNPSIPTRQISIQYRYRDLISSTCNTCTYNTTCSTTGTNCTNCGSSLVCKTCTYNTTCNTYKFCARGSTTGCISSVMNCCSDGECRASAFTCAGGGSSTIWCRHTSCGCDTYNTTTACNSANCGTTSVCNSCTYSYTCSTTQANCGECGSTSNWGTWSAWGATVYTASGTRQVELQYSYRDR